MGVWWRAVGHTEATYEQTRDAIAAGATVGTHLFNAMRPINTREPGPVIALLEDSRVTVELITDGVHVDPALYRHVTHSVGPDRVSLITDAMAATGMGDGVYHLGPVGVDVVDGVARVAGTDTIAGSTATMDRQFRFAVTHSGLPRDEALMLAVRQASINPARALGLPCTGLVPGAAADLVVLDSDLAVAGCTAPRLVGRRTMSTRVASRTIRSTETHRFVETPVRRTVAASRVRLADPPRPQQQRHHQAHNPLRGWRVVAGEPGELGGEVGHHRRCGQPGPAASGPRRIQEK